MWFAIQLVFISPGYFFLSYNQSSVNGNGTPYHSVQEIMPSNEIYGHGVIPQFIDITEVTFIVEGTN